MTPTRRLQCRGAESRPRTSQSSGRDRIRSGCAAARPILNCAGATDFSSPTSGSMAPQDGVDIVVRAANIVVNQLGRDDVAFTLIGSGDCFDDLVALRDELRLAGHVEFTGRAPDELVTRILSTADVGLSRIRRIRSMTCRR